MKTPPNITHRAAVFIGIDFHKRYSVYRAVDYEGRELAKGRIEHHSPGEFGALGKTGSGGGRRGVFP